MLIKQVQVPGQFALQDLTTMKAINCTNNHQLIDPGEFLRGKWYEEWKENLTPQSLFSTLADRLCPRLFVILPINPHALSWKEFFVHSFMKDGYALHLLCESPQRWGHFTGAPGYPISVLKPFLRRYGPHIVQLLGFLSFLCSVSSPLKSINSKVYIVTAVSKLMVDKLKEAFQDVCKKYPHVAPRWEMDGRTGFGDGWQGLSRNEISRKELCSLLCKEDEEGRFGSLIATSVGGEVRWLCHACHLQFTSR